MWKSFLLRNGAPVWSTIVFSPPVDYFGPPNGTTTVAGLAAIALANYPGNEKETLSSTLPLSTFLSSFGNREVRRDVLEGTIRKLDLNSTSPEKLFFEDPSCLTIHKETNILWVKYVGLSSLRTYKEGAYFGYNEM
ncbi:hypothetical protein KY284_001604 [Solanum tuberosum]|nr:hypothetical protein KY284_001604 [Solanum tuberosum]